MSKFNDTTGDRLSNTLKGDREAYSKGWDRVFGKKKFKAEDVEVSIDGEHVDMHMNTDDDLTKPLENALDKHRKSGRSV